MSARVLPAWRAYAIRGCFLLCLLLVEAGLVTLNAVVRRAPVAHAASVISSVTTNANGKPYIEVDGKPFLPLVVQYRADLSIGDLSGTDSFFADAKSLGFNTVSLPIWWGWIEPSQGTWDWTYPDNFISTANQYGLKVEFLWFGSDISGGAITDASTQYTNGYLFPSWITNDTSTYQRHINSNQQISQENSGDGWGTYNSFSFSGQNLLNQEKTALQTLMNHVASYDTHHTLIGMQIENETMINARICDTSNEADRSYDATTTAAFQSSGISDSQQFARNQLADWQNALGQVVKQSNYPVYTRMNYWGGGCGATFAEIKQRAPNIDFEGIDPYTTDIGAIRNGITANMANKGYGIAENGPYSDTPTLMLSSYDAGGIYYSTYTLVSGGTGPGLVNSDHSLTANAATISSALLQLEKDTQDIADHTPNQDIGYFHVMDTNASDSESKTLNGVGVSYTTSNRGMGVAIMNANDLLLMGVNGSGTFTVGNAAPDSIDEGYFDANQNWVSTGSASYTNNGNGSFSVTTGSNDFIRLHYNNGIGNGGTGVAPVTTIDDSVEGGSFDQFNYQGSGWGHCTNCDSPAIGRYDGSNSWDSVAGDTVSVKFNGTGVNLYTCTGPGGGYASASIDGGSATTIDNYSANSGCAVSLYHPSGLSQGNHTLNVVVSGTHDSNSSNDYVVIDRVDVTAVPLTLVDDSVQGSSTNQFNYQGSGWGHCTGCDQDNLGRYNQSNSWDNTAGDSFTFTFNGTGIVFFEAKGTSTGNFDVSLDGGAPTTINGNSAGAVRGDQIAWSSAALISGPHTLKVVVDGTGGGQQLVIPDAIGVAS